MTDRWRPFPLSKLGSTAAPAKSSTITAASFYTMGLSAWGLKASRLKVQTPDLDPASVIQHLTTVTTWQIIRRKCDSCWSSSIPRLFHSSQPEFEDMPQQARSPLTVLAAYPDVQHNLSTRADFLRSGSVRWAKFLCSSERHRHGDLWRI